MIGTAAAKTTPRTAAFCLDWRIYGSVFYAAGEVIGIGPGHDMYVIPLLRHAAWIHFFVIGRVAGMGAPAVSAK